MKYVLIKIKIVSLHKIGYDFLFIIYDFGVLFEKHAAINPKVNAAQIPAAAAVKPPVKIPRKPFSSTAFFTPSESR